MRNKKGSMELSVNSIVILVIAIVIMGLIIGFIRSKFSEVGGNLVTNEPDPVYSDYSDAFTLSRDSVSTYSGKAVIKADVFNTYSVNMTDVWINMSCLPTVKGLVFNSTKKLIPTGERSPYIFTLALPKDIKGNFICTLRVGNGSRILREIPAKDIILQAN